MSEAWLLRTPCEKEPLLLGGTGIILENDSLAQVGLHPRFAHYPPFIRVYAENDPENFPFVGIKVIGSFMDNVFCNPDVRKNINLLDQSPDGWEQTYRIIQYAKSGTEKANLFLRMLRTHKGLARNLKGLKRASKEILFGVNISAYGVAHLRVPRSLAYDRGVMFALAQVQGLEGRHIINVCNRSWVHGEGTRQHPLECHEDWLYEQFTKLLWDPWFQAAYFAHYFPVAGWDVGARGFTETAERFQYLRTHPYSITTGELEAMTMDPMWAHSAAKWVHSKRDAHAAGRSAHPSNAYYPKGNGLLRDKNLTTWAWFDDAYAAAKRREERGKR